MNMFLRRGSLSALLGLAALSLASLSHAQSNFHVSLNTSGLIGNSAAPFSMEFQLIDGGNNVNNTVTLSNFTFGAGSPTGAPNLTGGAFGSLASVVTLTDSAFFNEFAQQFTPGALLDFDAMLTGNVDSGGTPDAFTFSILDNTGVEIPTTMVADGVSFLRVDIDASVPAVQTGSADPALTTIPLSAPIVTAALVPEPGAWALVSASAVMGAGFCRRRKRG